MHRHLGMAVAPERRCRRQAYGAIAEGCALRRACNNADVLYHLPTGSDLPDQTGKIEGDPRQALFSCLFAKRIAALPRKLRPMMEPRGSVGEVRLHNPQAIHGYRRDHDRLRRTARPASRRSWVAGGKGAVLWSGLRRRYEAHHTLGGASHHLALARLLRGIARPPP